MYRHKSGDCQPRSNKIDFNWKCGAITSCVFFSFFSFWCMVCVQDCRTGKLVFCPALLGSFSCSCCAPCGSYHCWEHTALLLEKKTKIHLLIYLSSRLERATNVISHNKTSHVRIHRGDFLNLRFPLNFLSQIDWITIGCVSVSHL